jgi:3-deoxy-D-manno-octulosonic acid kinase
MPHESTWRLAQEGPCHLLFDPSFGEPSGRWFDHRFWADTGHARAADGGRGSAWFISSPHPQTDCEWVLRHYRRGGRAAMVSKDRYVFTGLERTRAFREWRLLQQLREFCLPAPVAVAAGVVRKGLTYRAHLITVAIPDTRTLASRLATGELDESLMADVGACVARFHAHGIWHADLNAHNVLIDGAGQIYLIDFDRGRQRDDAGWQSGNVARLQRSLNKLSRQAGHEAFETLLWNAFLSGYESPRQ